MLEKHSHTDLKKPYAYQEYPKVMYRDSETGDLVAPGYPKVVKPIGGGDAYLEPQFLPHETCVVHNLAEEEECKEQGWRSTLAKDAVSLKELDQTYEQAEEREGSPKRGPGRPRKQAEPE